MRRLIKEVAELVRDLETLKLLDKDNLTTSLTFGRNTRKYSLSVTVKVPAEADTLCLEMFQKLRSIGYSMRVLENNKENPLYTILSVIFYE